MGKLQAVHRSRHVNISENDMNIWPRFEYRNCFVSVSSFERVKTGGFGHFNCVQSDEHLVFNMRITGLFADLFMRVPTTRPKKQIADLFRD